MVFFFFPRRFALFMTTSQASGAGLEALAAEKAVLEAGRKALGISEIFGAQADGSGFLWTRLRR